MVQHLAKELVTLAWEFRDILFPFRGRLFPGTETDLEPVYEAILKVIGVAIFGMGSVING